MLKPQPQITFLSLQPPIITIMLLLIAVFASAARGDMATDGSAYHYITGQGSRDYFVARSDVFVPFTTPPTTLRTPAVRHLWAGDFKAAQETDQPPTPKDLARALARGSMGKQSALEPFFGQYVSSASHVFGREQYGGTRSYQLTQSIDGRQVGEPKVFYVSIRIVDNAESLERLDWRFFAHEPDLDEEANTSDPVKKALARQLAKAGGQVVSDHLKRESIARVDAMRLVAAAEAKSEHHQQLIENIRAYLNQGQSVQAEFSRWIEAFNRKHALDADRSASEQLARLATAQQIKTKMISRALMQGELNVPLSDLERVYAELGDTEEQRVIAWNHRFGDLSSLAGIAAYTDTGEIKLTYEELRRRLHTDQPASVEVKAIERFVREKQKIELPSNRVRTFAERAAALVEQAPLSAATRQKFFFTHKTGEVIFNVEAWHLFKGNEKQAGKSLIREIGYAINPRLFFALAEPWHWKGESDSKRSIQNQSDAYSPYFRGQPENYLQRLQGWSPTTDWRVAYEEINNSRRLISNNWWSPDVYSSLSSDEMKFEKNRDGFHQASRLNAKSHYETDPQIAKRYPVGWYLLNVTYVRRHPQTNEIETRSVYFWHKQKPEGWAEYREGCLPNNPLLRVPGPVDEAPPYDRAMAMVRETAQQVDADVKRGLGRKALEAMQYD